MFPNGLASQEGTIQKGNEVLSINGKSLKGATHGDALAILRQARDPRQAVVVTRRPAPGATPDSSSSTDSAASASVASDVSTESSKFSRRGGRPGGHTTLVPVEPVLEGLLSRLWPAPRVAETHVCACAHTGCRGRRGLERRASLTIPVPSSAAEATVLTVTLEKTSAGLGFSLEGGKGSLHGDKPLTVNRIFKGSCVSRFLFSPVMGGLPCLVPVT